MKKRTLAATLALLAMPFTASLTCADTIFGIYAGAGQWQADYSGNIGKPSIDVNQLGAKDSDNNFYYIALEHPIPLVPNIKLQKLDVSTQQTAVITQSFAIDGAVFAAGSNVTSDIDLSHTDLILYYEILDNWVNLDVGVNVRRFDGYVSSANETTAIQTDLDDTIPMVYAKAQFDLPFTGFSAGLEGNAANFGDDRITDYSAKIMYMFDSALDLGVEVGYREMSIDLDDTVKTDMTMKGPYAAFVFHF